ncbi:hypothetical protein Tco_0899651, partial [Tanacetum coccineum]
MISIVNDEYIRPYHYNTWYGVLRDSVVASEVVVRFHGYGGEINPIEAILCEKMSE